MQSLKMLQRCELNMVAQRYVRITTLFLLQKYNKSLELFWSKLVLFRVYHKYEKIPAIPFVLFINTPNESSQDAMPHSINHILTTLSYNYPNRIIFLDNPLPVFLRCK